MKRLSLPSLAIGLLISTQTWAVTSQYPCDTVVYANTLDHSERGVRVCFSDVGMSVTLDPKADGVEGIDKHVPISQVRYVQNGLNAALRLDMDDHTHYTISNNSQNLRLLTLSEDHVTRAYHLSSPTVDNLSRSLARFGVHVQSHP